MKPRENIGIVVGSNCGTLIGSKLLLGDDGRFQVLNIVCGNSINIMHCIPIGAHHLGLAVIVFSLLNLVIQKMVYGKRIQLPGHFFLTYAIGAAILGHYGLTSGAGDSVSGLLDILAAVLALTLFFIQ